MTDVFGNIMKNITWNNSRSIRGAALNAGTLPGVYLIGGVHEVAGIPMSYDWVYVGRSNNLARRLFEHLPARESNPQLRSWLIAGNTSPLIIKFAVISPQESIRIEKELIHALSPIHNRIKFKSGEHHEYFEQHTRTAHH